MDVVMYVTRPRHLHVCMYICMYVLMYVCAYVRMYVIVCMYVYMYVLCIYVFTKARVTLLWRRMSTESLKPDLNAYNSATKVYRNTTKTKQIISTCIKNIGI